MFITKSIIVYIIEIYLEYTHISGLLQIFDSKQTDILVKKKKKINLPNSYNFKVLLVFD